VNASLSKMTVTITFVLMGEEFNFANEKCITDAIAAKRKRPRVPFVDIAGQCRARLCVSLYGEGSCQNAEKSSMEEADIEFLYCRIRPTEGPQHDQVNAQM
jgi:hypothetical protein